MSAIDEIKRFATDRAIDKMDHSYLNYATSVFEELCEGLGYDVPKENRKALRANIESFVSTLEKDAVILRNSSEPFYCDVVDSICDIAVFSVTELQKLNIDPELALLETSKEINSRSGTLVNGKFEKDLSDEARALWYKADYESILKGDL